jgi:hypothetical protein
MKTYLSRFIKNWFLVVASLVSALAVGMALFGLIYVCAHFLGTIGGCVAGLFVATLIITFCFTMDD